MDGNGLFNRLTQGRLKIPVFGIIGQVRTGEKDFELKLAEWLFHSWEKWCVDIQWQMGVSGKGVTHSLPEPPAGPGSGPLRAGEGEPPVGT